MRTWINRTCPGRTGVGRRDCEDGTVSSSELVPGEMSQSPARRSPDDAIFHLDRSGWEALSPGVIKNRGAVPNGGRVRTAARVCGSPLRFELRRHFAHSERGTSRLARLDTQTAADVMKSLRGHHVPARRRGRAVFAADRRPRPTPSSTRPGTRQQGRAPFHD